MNENEKKIIRNYLIGMVDEMLDSYDKNPIAKEVNVDLMNENNDFAVMKLSLYVRRLNEVGDVED